MKNKRVVLNKLTVSILVSGVMLSMTPSLFAQSPTGNTMQGQGKTVRQEKREVVKEKAKNILEQVKDAIREKIKRQIKGKLISIAGNILTVQNNQATFTVTTTEKTQLKRRFGAISTLAEFKPNDELLIIGNRSKNDDGTLSSSDVEASYIRNMSIQRRFAIFSGEIKIINGNVLTLQTKGRGLQTVHVSDTTQYKEKDVAISLSKLIVGDKLIVKGELWDRVSNTIDAKTILRLVAGKKIPTTTPVAPTQKQE